MSLLTTSSGTCSRRSIVTNVWRRSCGVNASRPAFGPRDKLVDRRVLHRCPDLAAPEVDEHVVGIKQPVLVLHVEQIQLHHLRQDRHRSTLALPPGAV